MCDIGKGVTRMLHIGDDKIQALQAIGTIVGGGRSTVGGGSTVQVQQPPSQSFGMSTNSKTAIAIVIVGTAVAGYLLLSK